MRTMSIAACATAVLLLVSSGAHATGYEPHEVIVKYAGGVPAAKRMAQLHRSGVTKMLGPVAGVGARVVRVRGDAAAVATRLNRSTLVEYAEPNLIVRAGWFPNDPRFGELYGLHNTGQGGGRADADIDAPEGWKAAGLNAGRRRAA